MAAPASARRAACRSGAAGASPGSCERMWRSMAALEVLQADVTTLAVDAIANAANTRLLHGGGVAAAIARGGGPELQRESEQRPPIELGEAVETTAGDMPARYVIHAATMELGGPTSAAVIERATARRCQGRAGVSSGPVTKLPILVAPDSFKGTFSADARSPPRSRRDCVRRDARRRSCPSPTAARARWRCSRARSAASCARSPRATRSGGRSRPRSRCCPTAARRSWRRRRRAGSGWWPRTSATRGRPRRAARAS